MSVAIDHTRLHRTAKYFMDNGQAETVDEAMDLLRGFGLTVYAGPEVVGSVPHQIALLTLVNLARRTFLGGVEVVGMRNAPLLAPLTPDPDLASAVESLGARLVRQGRANMPAALIGTCAAEATTPPRWQLTWRGWSGGVIPAQAQRRLSEDAINPLAAAVAAGACTSELFAWYSGSHAMAGRRSAGVSLWRPDADWTTDDATGPALAYLPSRLWLIGLGNLGQAFAWLLACLPYGDHAAVELMLQDFDRIAESNDSTSLLSSLDLVGRKKTRAVGKWLERVGFHTDFEERRFGEWTRRGPHEPAVALCGVDNALARAELGKAGFELVVEVGLGAGPDGFRNFSMHSFPASRRPDQIWSGQNRSQQPDLTSLPAYVALRKIGLDACGLAQLASRTVGVPFVGLIAAAMGLSEPLRRLHGAEGLELVSGSLASLGDLDVVRMDFKPYAHGHLPAAPAEAPVQPDRSSARRAKAPVEEF